MDYPDYKTYELLYAKYINKDYLCDMMDVAGKDYTGKNFLDLCCGRGRAIREAQKRKAKYCLGVDKEQRMIPKGVHSLSQSVSKALPSLMVYTDDKKFDIVFCRQGINYWLHEINNEFLFRVMKKNGIFIFNTFNTKPSFKPVIKEYKIGKTNFCEISYLGGHNMVHHVQIREGYAPHITCFMWMSKEYINSCLKDHFKIEIITRNKTDIYKCIRN